MRCACIFAIANAAILSAVALDVPKCYWAGAEAAPKLHFHTDRDECGVCVCLLVRVAPTGLDGLAPEESLLVILIKIAQAGRR